MREPRRDQAISILGGLGISCLLYLLLMFACFGVLPDTAASTLPLADVAKAFLGPAGTTLVAIAAVISCAGGLAVAILTSPRNMFALGETGDLPPAFAAVHPEWKTPHVAIIVYAVLSWLFTVTGTFEYLVSIFVISRILAYGSTSAALLVLRHREGPAPVPMPGGPVIAVAALLCCAGIVLTTSWSAVRDVAIALAIGFAIRGWVRIRASRSKV